jgi:hypothetical protein
MNIFESAASSIHYFFTGECFKIAFQISSVSPLRFFKPQALHIFVSGRVEIFNEDPRERGLFLWWQRSGLLLNVVETCAHVIDFSLFMIRCILALIESPVNVMFLATERARPRDRALLKWHGRLARKVTRMLSVPGQ